MQTGITTVLSVENANNWSWGLVVKYLANSLAQDYKFIRMIGHVRSWHVEKCRHCENSIPVYIPLIKISRDIVKSFDLTLVQNVDSLELVDNGETLIGRMGGMRTFAKGISEMDINRFDDGLRKAAAIIATNGELFEIAKRINNRTFLIPNGTDLQLFQPRPQRQTSFNNGDNKPFIIGFAGNIHGKYAIYYKGWSYYVQATLRLRPGIETMNLLYRHNQIPHNEMPRKFYHKIDCLILPSVNEGCSNVVTEALACGVPVLLTKVGFHGERLEDGINCLFIKRDTDSIIKKVKSLINSPELRMKLAFEGRLFAENNHNIDNLARKYDKVFKLVLKLRKAKIRKE